MSGWNEDNFLERLMPQPPPNPGGKQNSCPDAETLCAVMEGETSGPLRDAVLEHLRQCAACADIQRRLLKFELAGEPEREAEWLEARSRLDNWLARLLGWDAVPFRPADRAEASRPVLGWKPVPKAPFGFKVQWALGIAAVVLLVMGGVFLIRRGREAPPQAQVARRATLPKEPPANLVPAEKPVEPVNAENRAGKQAAAAHHRSTALSPLGERVAIPRSRESRVRGSSPGAPTEGAQSQAATPQPSPSAGSNSTTQTAQAYAPPLPNSGAAQANATAAQANAAVAQAQASAPAYRPQVNARAAKPTAASPITAPATRNMPPVPREVAAAQAPALPPAAGMTSLREELQAQYQLVKMGSDSNGPRVIQPGTVLVIQKGGILGAPLGSSPGCSSNYENGSLKPPSGWCTKGREQGMKHGLVGKWGASAQATANAPNGVNTDTSSTRFFRVGEKVYLSNIAIDLKNDKISIAIVACDSCNGTNPPTAYKSQVVFQFAKGSLAKGDLAQIEDTIGQVFSLDSGDTQQAQITPTGQAQALRFETGTRVWIRLNSVNRQPDGSFTFKGSLHLPVQEANGIPLDRGTEINGSGTVSGGETSVFITDFALHGTRYTLKGASGTGRATPGVGKAIEFNGGQILEMWFSSDSIYEEAPDAGR